MSTRRRCPSGKTHDYIYTQEQCGVEPTRRADQYNQLFPSKPVAHRRPNNPKTQDSHNELDFEKITITKRPRGHLSQEHHSYGKETSGSQIPKRRDTQKLPSGELEMTRAIHEKQLMLQEKLWRLDAKVRQKFQRDSDDVVEGDDRGQGQRGKTRTETRLLEQKRGEAVQSRERQEEQQTKRKDMRTEDRMRNTHEEKMAICREERREEETEYLRRKACHGTQANKSRLEDVKDHTRGKGGYEEGDGSCRGRGGRATEITEEREQSSTLRGNKGWSRERKHREMYESDNDRELSPMSQHKTSHQAATQHYRGDGRNHSQEPRCPSGSSSSHSSRQEQEELSHTDNANHSLQLLPCPVCGRKFARGRLEKHVVICEKVKHSNRPVFNTFAKRTKGTSLGEYLKTHSRATTPEIIKKKRQRQSSMANPRNMHEVRPPAGTSNPQRFK
ncbi:uncharacterized protein LOC141806685 isoform X2 [Halichoeres trimaculatus]